MAAITEMNVTGKVAYKVQCNIEKRNVSESGRKRVDAIAASVNCSISNPHANPLDDSPNKQWLTSITKLSLADDKVYPPHVPNSFSGGLPA